MRGNFWHTSNFDAGPSDAGKFKQPPTVKKCGFSPPTSDLLTPKAGKMNGRDEQTDCRQQRNSTGLLPPERTHQGQEVSQIAQKQFVGKMPAPEHRNCPLTKYPPPPVR